MDSKHPAAEFDTEVAATARWTLPYADNSSIGANLTAWTAMTGMLDEGVNGGRLRTTDVASTYSLIFTSSAHIGSVLAANGDIHFVPALAAVGQKISANGAVSTYSLVYTSDYAYTGGVLATNGDIHFIPSYALVGQKIVNNSGVQFSRAVCASPWFNKL